MTRKDYVKIATVFALSCPKSQVIGAIRTPEYTLWLAHVFDMCDILQGDNVRFDRRRFLFACGLV